MKDTFYFPHDYEPTSDPKIGALLAKYGGAGYGIFWRLIEMLHSGEGHKIEKKKYIYTTIAQQMLTTSDFVSEVIDYAISDECELFQNDETHFWSDRVFRNIELRNLSREQRSLAGKASAQKRANDRSTTVEQPLTTVQRNPTKERKGKDSKEKEIELVYPFSSDEFKVAWERWKEYKRQQHGFKYKGTISEIQGINDLFKLSEGIEQNAIALIDVAISKTWKGIHVPQNWIIQRSTSKDEMIWVSTFEHPTPYQELKSRVEESDRILKDQGTTPYYRRVQK